MSLFHFGCSFNQSFCCIENLHHVQTCCEVCNWWELISGTEMLLKASMFLWNNHLLTTSSFLQNPNILPFCHWFICLLVFQNIHLFLQVQLNFQKTDVLRVSPKLKILFLFEASKQNCRLCLLCSSSSLGSRTKGSVRVRSVILS